MARKNTRNSDNSELFIFDQRTKAVMAHAQTDANSIKEKVQSVREIVPGRSNNEIVLVLQFYDNDVTQAIQAFLEDGAKEALQEWRHQPGNKPAARKKKRNKTKGANSEANVGSQGNLAGTEATEAAERVPDHKLNNTSASVAAKPTVNGHVGNEVTSHKSRSQPAAGSGPGSRPSGDTRSDSPRPQRARGNKPGALTLKPDPVTRPTPAAPPPAEERKKHAALPSAAMGTKSNHSNVNKPAASATSQRPHTLDGKRSKVNRNQVAAARDRTQSEASTTSTSSRKPLAGLEKSTKDLLRQTISLQRFKTTLNDEVTRSFKNITKVFEELRKQLNDREGELIYQLDSAKNQASETMTARQKRAVELKHLSDRSGNMNEAEIAELRADIKHFVSDRKVDEDIGTTQRFTCDLEHMGNEVKSFGQVHEVKHSYRQRRSSVSSLSSSIVSHDDLQSPFTPLSMSNPFSPSSSFSAQPPAIAASVSSSARVIGQSESLTRYESAELQNRLSGLPARDNPRVGGASGPRARPGPRPQAGKPNPRNTTVSEKEKQDALDEEKKSRNARRRQKQRERQKEQRKSDLSETESEQSISPSNKGQVKGQGEKTNKPVNKPDDQAKPSQGQKTGEEGQGRRSQGRRTPSPQKRRPGERPLSAGKEKKEESKEKDEGSAATKARSRNRNNRNRSDAKPAQNGVAKPDETEASDSQPKPKPEKKANAAPDKQVNKAVTSDREVNKTVTSDKEVNNAEQTQTNNNTDKLTNGTSEKEEIIAPEKSNNDTAPAEVALNDVTAAVPEQPVAKDAAPADKAVDDVTAAVPNKPTGDETTPAEVAVNGDIAPAETVKPEVKAPAVGDSGDQPRSNKSVTVFVKSDTKPPKTAEVSALGDVNNHVKTDVNANMHVNGGSPSEHEGALPQRKPRVRVNRRPDNKDMVNGDVHLNGDINSNSEVIQPE